MCCFPSYKTAVGKCPLVQLELFWNVLQKNMGGVYGVQCCADGDPLMPPLGQGHGPMVAPHLPGGILLSLSSCSPACSMETTGSNPALAFQELGRASEPVLLLQPVMLLHELHPRLKPVAPGASAAFQALSHLKTFLSVAQSPH